MRKSLGILLGLSMVLGCVAAVDAQTGFYPTPDKFQVGTKAMAPTPMSKIKRYAVSLAPVNTSANTCAEQNFTVTGLATTDNVFINSTAAQTAGVGIAGAWVSAANTLTLNVCNVTGTTKVMATATYNIFSIRVP